MNKNSIIDFTKRCNKNEVTLHYRKYAHDFACQDGYELNPDKLPPLFNNDATRGRKNLKDTEFCAYKFH